MDITTTKQSVHALTNNLKHLNKLGLMIWFACLITMLILPTMLGVSALINPLADHALLFGLLGPFCWIPALYYQAKLLRRQSVPLTMFQLLLFQAVLNVPTMILFLFYPYNASLLSTAMLQKIVWLSLAQCLCMTVLKWLLLTKLSVQMKTLLAAGILDSLSFALFWGVFVAPTDVAQVSESRIWTIKQRMHILQTMVETYAVDANGLYPENSEVLMRAAIAGRYGYALGTPLCDYYPLWLALRDLGHSRAIQNQNSVLDKGDVVQACGILFIQAQQGRSYFIYGFGPDGKLIQDKGQDFVLSNS